MFKLVIPTDNLQLAPDEGVEVGPTLATLLRAVADRVEADIQILPQGEDSEWVTETYRHAMRINGVLMGAVYELTAEG